eukprot:TRINITY_DN2026_c0_g1_i1.p1 TRINITY_DN2026_c0_g1~~TRINITY_DN2026_c0_g1_i1.p1  ORF type:complete len:384 (+),score=87.82 TRINITY_DN2026_c0_g1_i1:324-1475(+)
MEFDLFSMISETIGGSSNGGSVSGNSITNNSDTTGDTITTYILGGVDALLFFMALSLLLRIHVISNETQLKFVCKKVFHTIIALAMLTRSVFFFLYPTFVADPDIRPNLISFWNHSGEFLIFLAYFMLLLFWADFYHHTVHGRNANFFYSSRYVLGVMVVIFVAMFAAFAVLEFWLCRDSWSCTQTLDASAAAVIAGLFVLTACGFVVYGYRLFSQLNNFLMPSTKTQSQAKKVATVAVICTVCFTIRAALTLLAIDQYQQVDQKRWDLSWYFLALFVGGTECTPTFLILLLLFKLPTWRAQTDPSSAHYAQQSDTHPNSQLPESYTRKHLSWQQQHIVGATDDGTLAGDGYGSVNGSDIESPTAPLVSYAEGGGGGYYQGQT